MEMIVSILPLAIVASTPLVLAVLGELVTQRAGIINLGLEGTLLTAALGAVLAAQLSGSATAGFFGGIAAALVIAVLFALFTIVAGADQIVTGTALNLLAIGLTSFTWRELRSDPAFAFATPRVTVDVVLPLAWIVLPLLIGSFLWNSSAGLRLRASGENPRVLGTSGRSAARMRWLALMIEGVLAGLGGAYLALVTANGFAENMSAGRGFIALAIVIFGRWSVKGAIAGSVIFGFAAAFQYAAQAAATGISHHLLLALPYAVTLLILAGAAGKVRAPRSLGS